MMIKVLFVCLGNVCRSPMAEFMFKNMLRKEYLEDCFLLRMIREMWPIPIIQRILMCAMMTS